MLNTVYRLVAPRRFEIAFVDLDLFGGEVLVRPTHLSICHADQRYYQGLRDAAVLAKKLPMALIHEGIGEVVYDPTHTFKVGTRVVMIPNQPVEEDPIIAENYLRSSKFAGSSCDGFLQEYVALKPDRLIPLPDGINLSVAAFTELVSVSMHAVTRFERFSHARRETIGVWGDGNLSYMTSLLLKKTFPEAKICVFGIVRDKLADFTFVDETYLTNEIPDNFHMDHAFECVGGNGSPIAINQIIDYISPEGTISILGVSEYPVQINTRMMLEKGLHMFGTSRSGREDFERTLALYRESPEVIDYFSNLIGQEMTVRTVKDLTAAFEADIHKPLGKTIMKWEE